MINISRQFEKLQFKKETYEELCQDQDDKLAEEREKIYQEYIENHWVYKLIIN